MTIMNKNEVHWMVVAVQLMHLKRPYCKKTRNDKFLSKLVENMGSLKMPDQIYEDILARVFAGVESKRKDRERLLNEALLIFAEYIASGKGIDPDSLIKEEI
jgi:Fe-S cluster assembly ATPase SufC